jgi:hypothetical protein
MARTGAMSSDWVLPPPYSLTQLLERLPAHARRKYDDIKALLADSEALQRSLMERIKVKEDQLADLMRRRSYASDGGNDAEVKRLDDELAAVRADFDRLERERSKRNSVRANSDQVVSRLNNFLMERASGAVDVAPPPRLTSVPAGRKKGESTADALTRVRREIGAAKAELLRIRSAPPPSDEIKLSIIEEVDALAKEGRPLVTCNDGKVELHLPDVQIYASPGAALSAPSGSASKMLAWLFRKEMLRKLIAEVEDNEGGIPTIERPQRIREMEERIFGLEIAEEKLVCQALEAGLEVHRRIDANPWALLGYGVVAEEALQAAE